MGNCNCGPQTKAEDDADNEVILMPGDDVLRSSLTARAPPVHMHLSVR